MDKVLIFAGTTEGRELAEYLNKYNVDIHVCVATEYGEQLVTKGAGLKIHTGRLTQKEITELIRREQISLVVDATHPYAVVVSKYIRAAAQAVGIEYLRLLRSPGGPGEADIQVASAAEAVQYLSSTAGNILVTTGSKELSEFTKLPDYQERVYARVLATPEAVISGNELGFQGKHLICMQGPFSEELNAATMRQLEISFLVTKESGKNGGFAEKIRAAKSVGATIVLIGRPSKEQGLNELEIRARLRERLSLPLKRTVALVGIGMGRAENMTIEAKEACQNADVLIGAARMLETVKELKKPSFVSCQAEEIKAFAEAHPEYERIAIVLSGDPGFYSGARRLTALFGEEELQIYSGVSAVAYLCSKLHMSWEEVKLVSLHGRTPNIIEAVKRHRNVFALIGRPEEINELCERLICYGLEKVILTVGEALSYPEERIISGTAAELRHCSFAALTAVLLQNREAGAVVTHGLPDDKFKRTKVPMTKSEVRSIAISKLQLRKDSVVYDIGAGTGSVSIEAALQAAVGHVYAVEKNPDAVALIQANKERFAVENLSVVTGLAPEVLDDLPAPTHVFIGGSAGNLKEIMAAVLIKNPNVHMVISAIALETVTEAMRCVNTLPVTEVDIVHVTIGKSKEMGSYHMMMGQNPVYIISCRGGAKACQTQE